MQRTTLPAAAGQQAHPQRYYRVQGDWVGGGFGYTKPFRSEYEAMLWGHAKAKAHPDAIITVIDRGPVPAQAAVVEAGTASAEDRQLAAMFNGGAAADHLVAEPSRGFIASERAIAGNPLYFTGIGNFTLVNSPWLSHARVFATAEEAQAAVDPWNALGHEFVVGPKPEESATEYAQRRARENDRRALELQVNDPFVR